MKLLMGSKCTTVFWQVSYSVLRPGKTFSWQALQYQAASQNKCFIERKPFCSRANILTLTTNAPRGHAASTVHILVCLAWSLAYMLLCALLRWAFQLALGVHYAASS